MIAAFELQKRVMTWPEISLDFGTESIGSGFGNVPTCSNIFQRGTCLSCKATFVCALDIQSSHLGFSKSFDTGHGGCRWVLILA